mgnify:CR=1 FL=1
MSSAACEAWNLTISRPPTNRNVRMRVPAAADAAMQTIPTGFSAVPPSGPAIPVTPMPMSTRGTRPDAVGHRRRDHFAHGTVRFQHLVGYAE